MANEKQVNKDDIITLSNGEDSIVIMWDENPNFNNIYVVQLSNGQRRVVDRKTLTLASLDK